MKKSEILGERNLKSYLLKKEVYTMSQNLILFGVALSVVLFFVARLLPPMVYIIVAVIGHTVLVETIYHSSFAYRWVGYLVILIIFFYENNRRKGEDAEKKNSSPSENSTK